MRDSGIETIGSIPRGTHFCFFYKAPEDLIGMLIPYLKAGLLNDEYCICVTSGLVDVDEVKHRMSEAITGFDDYVRKGQVEIMPYSELYKPAGIFDRERAHNTWIDKIAEAKMRGFNGLRVTGDASWLEKRDWKSFMEYERAVNDTIGLHDMIALCTYSLERCDVNDIMEVMSSHQFTLTGPEKDWSVIGDHQQKIVRKALYDSDEKFHALAEMSSAVIAVYQGNKLVYVNDAAEKVTGYSKDELLSMDFWDIMHEDYRDIVMERGHARQKGDTAPTSYEVKFITRTGELKWAELNVRSIIYNGKPAGITTFFDITERKRIENELAEAKARMELYLDVMSHDITNMHQVAMGYLEIARDTEPDENKLELIDKPMEVLQRSDRLIKNVNKLQKLNERLFEPGVYDLSAVLKEVQQQYGIVPNKPVTLNLNGHQGCYVRANELLGDVFANLVSNAIKHTKDKTEVTISLETRDNNGFKHYRVSVEDNGPGVHDDFKDVIFNRMLKGNIKAKGMGLGLYLVKSLVDSYDGKVCVEDKIHGDYTKGARFVVMLPIVNK